MPLIYFYNPLLSLCWAIQAIIAGGWLLHQLHWAQAVPVQVLNQYPSMVRPEIEWVFFIVFIGVALIAQVFLLKKKPDELTGQRILVEVVLTALMGSASFKTVIYDYRAQLATGALGALFALAVLFKIYYRVILLSVGQWFIQALNHQAALRWCFHLLFIGCIIGWIFVPDIEAVVARMFIGEQFHHMDSFAMAQGWTVYSGGVINKDTLSQYGVGLPMVLAWAAKLAGGFTYEHITAIVMYACIIYYVILYIFLYRWFKSCLLAAACWVWAFKIQMFYTLSYPCILTYPQSTIIRGFFDIGCFAFLLAHSRNQKNIFLWGAAVLAGLSLWLMTSSGMYLVAALIAWVLIKNFDARRYGWFRFTAADVIAFFLMVMTVVILYYASLGNYLFDKEIWKNTANFIKVFVSGYWSAPFTSTFEYRQFWDLSLACLIPTVYMLTVMIVLLGWWHRLALLEDAVAVVISLYGLGLFEHYVTMSIGSNYFSKVIPFTIICFYWINKALNSCSATIKRQISVGLFLFALFALLTTHHFISYPNVFNFSRNPMTDQRVAQLLPTGYPYFFHRYRQWEEDRKLPLNSLGQADEQIISEYDFKSDEQLKQYYRIQGTFTPDVHLIQGLTGSQEKVVLLSSFEVRLLMQANRKPFFYVFQFLESRPMTMRFFPVDTLFTTEHLTNILAQLDAYKPPYIFMEKIFLNKLYPARYERDTPGLVGVLKYVWANYTPVQEGYYLVAMKRNGS